MSVSSVFTRTRVFWRKVGSVGAEIANSHRTHMVFTVNEACSALRVSRWTLYNLIRSGQLATIKLGKRRLIPETAVQALIERLQADEARL